MSQKLAVISKDLGDNSQLCIHSHWEKIFVLELFSVLEPM